MTTDLEQRVRRALDDDASKAPRVERAPDGIRSRVRRRQAGTATAAVAGLAAVVALTFAGIQAFDGDDRYAPTPAEQDTRPVFERTASIEGFTVTAPSDWYLVDYWPVMGRVPEITEGATEGHVVSGSEWYPGGAGVPVLQLTNYDPSLGAPICGSPLGDNKLASGGVGIYVGFDAGATRLPSDELPIWPDSLESAEPRCAGGGTELRFGLRRGGEIVPYVMWFGAGPEASDEARADLDAIVDALAVDADQPEIRVPGSDSPGFVLWGGTNDDGSTWTIEARPTEENIDLKLVARDADGTYSEGGYADFDVPPKDVEGGFMGVVTEDADRVEFRPADGSEPAVAQLTDLPGSLGYAADAYWFPEGYPTKDGPVDGELVAVMPVPSTPSSEGRVLDREIVGRGTDPYAGPWTLEATVQASTDGSEESFLRLSSADGPGGMGNMGPLGNRTFGMTQTGYGTVTVHHLFGAVSVDAARVVFEPASGSAPVEGLLFPLSDRFIGPAQIFLVFDGENPSPELGGRLIAYDAKGTELGRRLIVSDEPPSDPAPEAETPNGAVLDRALLAEGTYPEPDGRAWSLEIQIGDGIDPATGEPPRSIGLSWEEGGGGGGSISSLEGHVFNGHQNVAGTGIPDSLFGPVSVEASRVVLRPAGGGDPIEAQLVAVPDRFLGPAQIFLVTVGTTVPDGRLIAFDERGQVLDTYPVDYRSG